MTTGGSKLKLLEWVYEFSEIDREGEALAESIRGFHDLHLKAPAVFADLVISINNEADRIFSDSHIGHSRKVAGRKQLQFEITRAIRNLRVFDSLIESRFAVSSSEFQNALKQLEVEGRLGRNQNAETLEMFLRAEFHNNSQDFPRHLKQLEESFKRRSLELASSRRNALRDAALIAGDLEIQELRLITRWYRLSRRANSSLDQVEEEIISRSQKFEDAQDFWNSLKSQFDSWKVSESLNAPAGQLAESLLNFYQLGDSKIEFIAKVRRRYDLSNARPELLDKAIRQIWSAFIEDPDNCEVLLGEISSTRLVFASQIEKPKKIRNGKGGNCGSCGQLLHNNRCDCA